MGAALAKKSNIAAKAAPTIPIAGLPSLFKNLP
jgi:hypothetical protein